MNQSKLNNCLSVVYNNFHFAKEARWGIIKDYILKRLHVTLLGIFVIAFSTTSTAQITPVQTIWSVADGNWNSAATWDSSTGSRLPNASDNVVIHHQVNLNTNATVNSISLNNQIASTRLVISNTRVLTILESTNYAISILGQFTYPLLLNVLGGGTINAINNGPVLFDRSCACNASIRLQVQSGGTLNAGNMNVYYINTGDDEGVDEVSFRGNVNLGSVYLTFDNDDGNSNLFFEVISSGVTTINGNLIADPVEGADNGDIFIQVGNLVTDDAILHVTGDLILLLDSEIGNLDDTKLETYGNSQLIIDGEFLLHHNSDDGAENIEVILADASSITCGTLRMISDTDSNGLNNLILLEGNSRLTVLGDVFFTSFAVGGSARRANQIELDGTSILELQGNVYSTSEGRIYFTNNNSTAWVYITGSIQQTLPNIYNGGSSGGNTNSAYTGIYGNLRIDNNTNDPVLLEDHVVIRNSLNMVTGFIQTGTTNTFTFSATATSNSGNSDSFIIGPVYKLGTLDLTIPMGDQRWAPIRLSNFGGGDATTTFEIEYFNDLPPDDTNFDSNDLDHISTLEYWPVRVVAGLLPTTVDFELFWPDACASVVEDVTAGELFVSRYDGTSGSPIWDLSNTSGQTISGGSQACDVMDGDAETGSVSATLSSLTDLTYVTIGAFSTLNTLPVELFDFTASVYDDFIDLKWQTASELNNKEFIIEKSAGEDFYPIGSVRGKGTISTSTSYNFIDDDPGSGVSYYRLKQVDFDGSFTYSSTISADYTFNYFFYAYPNPARAGDEVNFNEKLPLLSIYDIQGNLIHQQKNAANLAGKELGPGIYFLKNQRGQSFKLIIQ